MDLDLEELAAVIELLDKADFTDFRYEKGDLRIAVRRGGPPLDEQPGPVRAGTVGGLRDRPGAPAARQPARVAAPSPPRSRGRGRDRLVRASMLGTFYRSPKPGDAAFVEIGDKVDADSVVCIVEVMKLMNSVTAGVGRRGRRASSRENGDLVEFDQPLFVRQRPSRDPARLRRQPGRDRRPHHRRLRPARATRPSLGVSTADRDTLAARRADRVVVLGGPRPADSYLPGCPSCCTPRIATGCTPSTPATASCPSGRDSPGCAPRTASPSSARRPRRSRPSATSCRPARSPSRSAFRSRRAARPTT